MRRERGGLVVLCLFIGLIYWALNSSFEGPAFLSDEVGYLGKAATLASWTINLQTGWHGGYSFFLAPSFLLFEEPARIFQFAVLTNACLWAITFACLWGVLRKLYPEMDGPRRLGTVALCALYPAWIVSCGYAIATTALCLLFTLSVLCLLRPGWAGVIFHSVCVGLLFWCHPTGLAVAIASLLSQLLLLRRNDAVRFLTSATVIGLLIAAYHWGLNPWFQQAAGDGATRLVSSTGGGRYTSSGLFAVLGTVKFYKHLLVMLLGQVSYFIVSTFGIGLYGALTLIQQTVQPAEARRPEQRTVSLFLLLSLLGLITMGALYLAKLSCEFQAEGIHTWIYGRYQEIAWLPLIAVGLRGVWPRRWVIAGALQVALTGGLMYALLRPENTGWSLIYLNVQGFWPAAVVKSLIPWLWMALGSIGVALVGLIPRKISLVPVLPLIAITLVVQQNRHLQILSDYSRPNDLRGVVKQLYPRGTPVVLDPSIADESRPGEQQERPSFYSFYLYDYPQRMGDFQAWLRAPRGPYLTYDLEKAGSSEVQTVALENRTGLLLLVPSSDSPRLSPESGYQGVSLDPTQTGRLASGCYSLTAPELAIFSATGVLTEKGMTAAGGSGPLFYGPYLPLKAGRYQLTLKGEFRDPAEAFLDVSSEVGQSVHLQADIGNEPSQTFEFELPQDAGKLEVRLFVHPASRLSVQSYAIEPLHP